MSISPSDSASHCFFAYYKGIVGNLAVQPNCLKGQVVCGTVYVILEFGVEVPMLLQKYVILEFGVDVPMLLQKYVIVEFGVDVPVLLQKYVILEFGLDYKSM